MLICELCYLFELPQIHDCVRAPSYLCLPKPNMESSTHGSKGPLASCLLSQCLPDAFPLGFERYNESEENTRNWDFKTRSQQQASSLNDGFWEGGSARQMLQRCRDEKAGLRDAPSLLLKGGRLTPEMFPCLRL